MQCPNELCEGCANPLSIPKHLAEPRGMRPLIPHCHLDLGNLHRRTGTREQAQEHLAPTMTMYREMGMQFWLEQAEGELKEYT